MKLAVEVEPAADVAPENVGASTFAVNASEESELPTLSEHLGNGIEKFDAEAVWIGGVETLPPMPVPLSQLRRLEASRGVMIVTCYIAVCIGLTCFVSQTADELPQFGQLACIAVISSEAIVAFLCLAFILFGNPGVMRRSPAVCFPIPPEVLQRLSKKDTFSGTANIARDGHSFCVRCLIWRPDSLRPHHCSVCQRCVVNFDHHCGVLGRCIAGRLPGASQNCMPHEYSPWGNLFCFWLLLSMAGAGVLTCGGCAAVAWWYDSPIAQFVVLLALLAMCCSCCVSFCTFIWRACC